MNELAKDSSSKTPPHFSVVIVCLNAGKHIGEALESVIEQDYPSFEAVVIAVSYTHLTLPTN